MPVKLHLMPNITVTSVICHNQNGRACLPHPNKLRGSEFDACDCLPGFTAAGDEYETNIDECQCFPCFRGTLTMSLTQARVPLMKITNSENRSLYNKK